MAVFARVVETGGFTAAARELGLSKGTVSKQVARLEERLGARLMNRTTRQLHLTDAGQAYYDGSARILAEVEEVERAVAHLQSRPSGLLRLTCPVSFGQRFVAAAVADFMAELPDLEVEMVLSDRFVDIVEEGYDVAIRIGTLPDSSLVARKLAPMRRCVCATREYFERRGRPQHPTDLAEHNCLLYTYEATGTRWRLRGPDGPVSVQVSGTLHVNNGDVIRQAVLRSVGVGFLPGFIVDADIREGRIEAVLEEWSESDAAVFAVYPHRRHVAAKVRSFVDFMAARFAGQGLGSPA
jgi:DNA-binding transcriptional LysR family regulator